MLEFNQFEIVSFDCYGTLIDWERGILPALPHLLSNRKIDFSDDGILELFADFEAELENQKNHYIRYRDILQETALKHKYKLAVISNIDDDLFAVTAKYLRVEFDWLITAKQVRSYKPSTRNFEIALETMGIAPEKLLHVAQSVYHDILPAASMGISTVWVNRRQDKTGLGATLPASGQPDLEVPNLKTLVEVIG